MRRTFLSPGRILKASRNAEWTASIKRDSSSAGIARRISIKTLGTAVPPSANVSRASSSKIPPPLFSASVLAASARRATEQVDRESNHVRNEGERAEATDDREGRRDRRSVA